jgi:hypothetical protein
MLSIALRNRRWPLALGPVLLGLLFLLIGARAEPLAPAATTTFIAVADAYLDQADPMANFGAEAKLLVERDITQPSDPVVKEALVRFDLTAIPAGATINRATLRLYQTAHIPGFTQTLVAYRFDGPWREGGVNWPGLPPVGALIGRGTAPDADEVWVEFDITGAVDDWVNGPEATPNHGLVVRFPDGGPNGGVVFSSREGDFAPQLVVDYAPPASLAIPVDADSIELDGFCREYANAAQVEYNGPFDAPGTVYLRHSNKYLYVCARAFTGPFNQRYFSLYLDSDNGREVLAEKDDYALQVDVLNGALAGLIGTGQGGYEPGDLPAGFEAATVAGDGDLNFFDSVEYRIPLPLFYSCQRPFGIALYQHWVQDVGDDYGWPSAEFFDQPRTWVEATLLDTDCTARNIQVCRAVGDACLPAPEATLYRIPADGGRERLALDNEGFVGASSVVQNGDRLWATWPAVEEAHSTLLHTSATIPVDQGAFEPDGTLRVEIGPERPLLLQDLAVSAQWLVEGDPVYRDLLADRIRLGSDYFYDFTAGQFMLGNVTVYQMGEQWEASDVRLYLSNVNRPNSAVGGIVDDFTPDISPSVAISYAPGALAMGKEWNRYMAPPGQSVDVGGVPVNPLTLVDDWSIALAHELGHYLLFLFDTYVDAEGGESQALGERCYGSAMGQVYDPLNHSFVWDPTHWEADCGTTQAYAETGGRTEWETIQGWYPWTVSPTGPQPVAPAAPMTPAVSLTTVTFVSPSNPPTQPLAASPIFDLLYVDNETASYEARAFTFREDRIFDQGKPPAGLNQVELTDARINDRFCVFDLNDHGEGAAAPRYQFGCETIQAGDAALNLTKNEAWRPLVEAKQLDTTRMAISVTQEFVDPAAAIRLRIYPEYKDAYPAVTMNREGNLHTYTVDFGAMGDLVMPFFMRFWVEESLPAPQSARETVADRGTGGGGLFGPAWHGGGVLVISSDGHARFVPTGGLELLPGQSVAWQSMPGTPPMPPSKRIVGQAYRLDAYPATLVDEGVVEIEFTLNPADAAEVFSAEVTNPTLHFWDGQSWQALPTTVQALGGREDGLFVASAASNGTGVYAVLSEQAAQEIWLPLVRQP